MQAATLLPGINWEAAVIAARAAVLHAEANGWRINVAVVDRSGNLMSFLRMPGAFLHSIDIAIDKAYTAASFGFSTKDWMSHIGHDDGMKFGFSARPRLVVFGGGLPIPAGGADEVHRTTPPLVGVTSVEDLHPVFLAPIARRRLEPVGSGGPLSCLIGEILLVASLAEVLVLRAEGVRLSLDANNSLVVATLTLTPNGQSGDVAGISGQAHM